MPVGVGLIMVSCLFLSVPPLKSGVLLNRTECKAACRLHLIILNRRNIKWYQVKKVSVVPAHYSRQPAKNSSRIYVIPGKGIGGQKEKRWA